MRRLVALSLFLASTAYGEIYSWKDSSGTAHYSNNLQDIPARFLNRARLLNMATGKKSPIPPVEGGKIAAAAPPPQPLPATGAERSRAPESPATAGNPRPPRAQRRGGVPSGGAEEN